MSADCPILLRYLPTLAELHPWPDVYSIPVGYGGYGDIERIDDKIDRELLQCRLVEVFGMLLQIECLILIRRFGLGLGQGMTRQATADCLGFDLHEVIRIEAQALRKLRHPLRNKMLRDWK